VEHAPQPEPTQDEGQQAATQEEDFLFEVAKDPREHMEGPMAVGKRCFCYCYCTKG
jgi:hypothetical protein